MTFFINAWLERDCPLIELRETGTNRMVYQAEGDALYDLLDKGELSVNDLNGAAETNKIIRYLLLQSIAEDIQIMLNNHTADVNVIKFPREYKRTNSKYITKKPRNNVINLFSLLRKKVLNNFNNAIY